MTDSPVLEIEDKVFEILSDYGEELMNCRLEVSRQISQAVLQSILRQQIASGQEEKK